MLRALSRAIARTRVMWAVGLWLLGLPTPGVHPLPTPHASISRAAVGVGGGINLSVAVAGDPGGEAIVLLHDYPATAWFWRGLIDQLLQSDTPLRLWMPDQRGFNHSSRPLEVSEYGLPLLVSDAAALARHAQSQQAGGESLPVHIVGQGFGGMVGWALAAAHPSLVASLTVVNGPHPSVWHELLRVDSEQQQASAMLLHLDATGAESWDPAGAICAIPSNASTCPSWWDAETSTEFSTVFGSPEARLAGLNWVRANVFDCQSDVISFGLNFDSGLPAAGTLPFGVVITRPSLVLWGLADPWFANDAMLGNISNFVQDGQLKIKRYATGDGLPASHWIVQEQPQRVANDILSFCNLSKRHEGSNSTAVPTPLWKQVITNSLLALLFFGLAATVDMANFRSKFAERKGIGCGLCCQFLIVPFLGYCSCLLFSLDKVYTVYLLGKVLVSRHWYARRCMA